MKAPHLHFLIRCCIAAAALGSAASSPASTDVVIEWNGAMTQLNENQTTPPAPIFELRAYAMAHVAMFNAVAQASRSTGNAAAAGAQAAHDVLVRLLPAGTAGFDELLARHVAALPPGPDRLAGLSIGAAAAARLLAERDDDGASTSSGPYHPGAKPGDYQFTPPFNGPPYNGYVHYPKLGQTRPFVLSRADQFHATPPYGVNDAEYAFDFNEVKLLGGLHSTARTADQTDIARFWYEASAFGWNRLARTLAAMREDSLLDHARLFAALNTAMADAFIASFESKYAYNFWRPITAIRAAETDGNPFTTADPAWEPLMRTPPMPDYLSTHAAQGGAASVVLIWFFRGDERDFTLPSSMAAKFPGLPPRTFHRISDAAVENALSRLYAGIHFRFACLAGLKQGRDVGDWVVRNAPFATAR